MLVKLQAQCQHFKKESNLVSFKDFAYLIRKILRTTSITKKIDLYLYCMSQPCMTRTTSITKKIDLYLYCMSQPCMTCDNCTPLV